MQVIIKVQVDKNDRKFIYVLEQHIREYLLKDLSEYEVENMHNINLQYNVDDSEFEVDFEYDRSIIEKL